jgi:hypothetical protein
MSRTTDEQEWEIAWGITLYVGLLALIVPMDL